MKQLYRKRKTSVRNLKKLRELSLNLPIGKRIILYNEKSLLRTNTYPFKF